MKEQTRSEAIALKGQCHKIFDLFFFINRTINDKQTYMFFYIRFHKDILQYLKFEKNDSAQATEL